MRPCGMSEAARQELWQRYRHGETHRRIGIALGCDPSAVSYVLRQRGGIGPPPRRRAAWTLARREREEISRGLARGESFTAIAVQLQRPTSTVSREVARHGGRRQYRAERADRRAWARAQRPEALPLGDAAAAARAGGGAARGGLVTAANCRRGCTRRIPDNRAMQVSHETIYRSLFTSKAAACSNAPSSRTYAGGRTIPAGAGGRGAAHRAGADSGRRSRSRERPAASRMTRAVPGHWEGDSAPRRALGIA